MVPRFVVVSMERRQSPLAATQLPAGAEMLTCEPKLEYPTLVPTLRSPATAMTPGTTVLQLPGNSTGPLELPAETTTRTPSAVTVSRRFS